MNRRLHPAFVNYLVLAVAFVRWCDGNPPEFFGIGAMLSSPEYERIFDDAVSKINENSSGILGETKLNGSSYVLSPNPIRSARDVCENLVAKGVVTVIVSHPKDELSPPISVSYACSFYQIPVIGISARETIFSDKSIHESFLRTVPSYSDQANVWLGLLNYYQWNKVIMLTSNDQDSRMIATRFTGLAERNDIKIEKTVMFPTGCENVTSHLVKIKKLQSRVILFSASEEDAAVVYKNASSLKMTGEGFVWLVTQQSLSGNARSVLPQGVIGMQLLHGYDESAQIQDAVKLVATALDSLVTAGKTLSPPPSSCRETTRWDDGQTLFDELVNTTIINGKTGDIMLNRKGDRINTVYQIVNLRKTGDKQLTVVGEYRDGNVAISDKVIWPGSQEERPEGIFVSTHLRVVTLVGEPFVFIKSLPDSGKCEDLDDADKKQKHIKCSGKVYGEDAKMVDADQNDHCCYGN
ncbi:hypothetical protein ACROYT_G006496 [Oculina patagonica]